jgi:hypothetical protein
MRFLLGFLGAAVAVLSLTQPSTRGRRTHRPVRVRRTASVASQPARPVLHRLSAYYCINLN